ncbi:MAG: hypothetical protein HY648_11435 [Acidobacteria bacterium]|nr:hypothetical protein [Acidobacteriota bacterium]
MSPHKARISAWLKPEGGFTLVETLLAMSLLVVGVVGLATLIPYATQNDLRSRIDTSATFIAMRELEQIVAQPFLVTNFTDAKDAAGNSVLVSLNCGTAPCSDGARLVEGLIDFTQPYADVPAGYRRVYQILPSADSATPKVNHGIYEIRWNISENASGARTIVIASRPRGNNPGATAVPANLRAVRMR